MWCKNSVNNFGIKQETIKTNEVDATLLRIEIIYLHLQHCCIYLYF